MKISIIVPIYNVEKYIKKCINSLLNQTYKDIEIILVEDGSPDNCRNICDEYGAKDKRINVIHQKNEGVSAARNNGTNIATGEYIMYVDGDDYIEKTACEELVKIINKYKADIICFNCNKIDLNGKKIIGKVYANSYTDTGNVDVLTYEQAMIDNLYRNKIRYEPWNKIYKKELVNKVKFPLGMLAEDFATFYKFLQKSNKIVHYDRCLYNYVIREGSTMNKKDIKLYVDTYSTDKKMYLILNEICKEKEDINELEKRYFNSLAKTYTKLYREKDRNYARLKKEIENNINKIDIKKLDFKEKILYLIYRINKPMFILGMEKIYRKV